MPTSKVWNRMAESKRARYVNTGQASRELDGLLSPGQIRDMCLKGEVPGAIKVRQRVLIPLHVLPSLIVELEFSAQPRPLRKPQPSTFDATRAV